MYMTKMIVGLVFVCMCLGNCVTHGIDVQSQEDGNDMLLKMIQVCSSSIMQCKNGPPDQPAVISELSSDHPMAF